MQVNIRTQEDQGKNTQEDRHQTQMETWTIRLGIREDEDRTVQGVQEKSLQESVVDEWRKPLTRETHSLNAVDRWRKPLTQEIHSLNAVDQETTDRINMVLAKFGSLIFND